MSKEIWMGEFERLYSQLVDMGVPDDLAYEMAGRRAHDATSVRLADMIDMARLRKKEGNL